MKLERRSGKLILAATLLALSLVAKSGFAQSMSAGDFLLSTADEAMAQLTAPDLSDAEKERRFRALMDKAFDIPRISKFVLGVNWRRATPEQREEFVEVFKQSNTKRFLPLFAEYADDKIEVTKERQDANNPKLYFVTTQLNRAQGEPISVEWRISDVDNQYKILDASAEGVSIVLSLRQEYGEVVQTSGVDGLIAELKRKVAGQPTSAATANN